MKTVHEVSRLTGISIRTLQYYDQIGLLSPSARSEAGYRLYDDGALEKLQQILLFRSLEFPLKEIRQILDRPDFDPVKALEQQIALLKMRREHIDNLIRLAQEIKNKGGKHMDFNAFDTSKMEEYAAQAKASWGHTDAYREYEGKSAGRTPGQEKALTEGMMAIFAEFGAIRAGDPAGEEAQSLVKKLQGYITEHMYTCTDAILLSLGQMYAAGGDFTKNIDACGGEGTGAFAYAAIRAHCGA